MIFKKDIKLFEKNNIYDPTHIIIMVDLVTISVETPRIDNGNSLEKEFN